MPSLPAARSITTGAAETPSDSSSGTARASGQGNLNRKERVLHTLLRWEGVMWILLALTTAAGPRTGCARAHRATDDFELMDRNGDGYITANERRA